MRGKGPAGSRMRYGENGRGKRINTDGAQWSDEAEAMFFDLLAASCNVKASGKAVGFTTATVYYQRRKRPEFGAKWAEALAQGYARVEMAMVRAAAETFEGEVYGADREIPTMSAAEALNLLRLHGPEVRGVDRRPGRFARRRSLAEIHASILKKIEAIENAPDDEEDDEDGAVGAEPGGNGPGGKGESGGGAAATAAA